MTARYDEATARMSRGQRTRITLMAASVAILSLGVTVVAPAAPAEAAAPAPTIYSATDLSNTSATLNASVDPGGTSTALTFCYSTSAITISGSSCTVASGTIAYATAAQSPSTSSSTLVFSAAVTGLAASTKYYVAAGAAQTAGSTSWSSTTTFTTVSGAPFTCSPDFYQANGDYLWKFDALNGTYVKVNATAQATSLNGIGYDEENNYVYGVGGSTLYQVDSNGNETSLGTPTNISSTGGDFLPGTNYLLTENANGAFYLEDVTSPSPASAVKPNSVVLGTTSGSASFNAYDVSMQLVGPDYVGYGLAMTSGSSPATASLLKVVIPVATITANDNSSLWSSLTSETIPNAVTVTALAGISFPTADTPTASDTFGAAYSDVEGDAFFYANTLKELFMAPAASLATGAKFALTAMATGTGLATGANDGANCQAAASPFSPPVPVNDTYTVVAGNTLAVNASAGTSLLANDQILSGASVTMGTTTLEPGGADVSKTFSAGTTSGTLTGANGTLDVTNAAEGYFTFAPGPTFSGPETFTYNLVETSPYGLTSATSATVTINVVQQQVVSWTTPTALTTTQLSSTPNPATDLGNAPITYSVVTSATNSAGCSVNATTGAITYVGAGVCTLQATAAATSSYSSASAQVTFTVSALTIPTLSWSPSPTTLTTAQSGTTISGAPVTNSNGAVSYAVAPTGNTAGCTLASSSSPVVLSFTATTAAQCSVTVSTAATATYAADSVTTTFTILPLPTFSWVPSPTTFTTSQSPQGLAGASTDSDGVVTYAVAPSGDSAGCSLASSSAPVVLSFTSAGECTVTAGLAATTSYAGAGPLSQVFTIDGPALTPQAIAFTSDPGSPQVGDTYTPVATGGGSGNPVTYTIDPSSTSGCTIDAGVVTFTGPAGSCVIDADQAGDGSYSAAPQATQTVTVATAPQAITFTSSAGSPQVGDTYTPTATGGGSGNPVTFSIDPSSTSGCTIDAGLVTFVGPAGTCVVDADQAGDGSYGAAPQVTQTVTVATAPQAITFTSDPGAPQVGGTYTPVATGGGSGNPVTFSIDLLSLGCSYDPGTGVVSFSLPGECIIDADQTGNGSYSAAPQTSQEFEVVLAGLIPQAIAFTSDPGSPQVGDTYTPTATGGGSGNPVTFSIDPSSTSGCTIDAGLVTFVGPAGTCVVDADQAGDGSYGAAPQVTQTVTVATAPQAITFTSDPGAPQVGGTYTPVATGGGSGNPVTFSIDLLSLGCSYDPGTGVVSFSLPGECIIDADQTGDGSYSAAPQTSQEFEVVLAGLIPQAIAFTSDPGSPQVGDTYTPTATGGGSGNPVTFSIDPSSTSGCTIDAGVVTFTGPAGSCVIDADQAGDGSYSAAPQATQTVTVATAPQAITFTSSAGSPQVGDTYTPTATGGGSGNPVTFSIDPSSTSGCTIDAGLVTFVGPAGTCVIDADQAGDGSYGAAPQATQTVTVATEPQAITFTSDPGSPQVGDTYTPTATGGGSGNPVTYTIDPSSTSGCTIDSLTGLVTFSGPAGTCVIDADQAGDGSYGAAAQTSQTVTVSTVPQVVTVTDPPTSDPVVGSTWTPTATGGGSGNPVTYTVDPSSTSGCTIDPVTDVVTLSAPAGTCVVDIHQGGNGSYGPASQQVVLHVVAGPSSTPVGYRLAGDDGGVFAFGGAPFLGSLVSRHVTPSAPIVGLASTPDGQGYWLVGSDGNVYAFGDAALHGSLVDSGRVSDAPIVGMAATPDGGGYWLVAADGGVFAFGDASFHGNTYTLGIELQLDAPIVGMAATPDGGGYWLVAADGGVFAFGDASFHGNTYTLGIEHQLDAPIVGMAATPDGGGYWLVAADGGVFAFGDASFHGNTYTLGIEHQLDAPIVGMAATPDGGGYWLVAADGGVFAFGDAPFDGSLLSIHLDPFAPIDAVAPGS